MPSPSAGDCRHGRWALSSSREATCRRLVISSLRERYLPDNGPSAPSAAGTPAIRFRVLGSLDLRSADGDELRPLLVQPKRLALFAYLTLANPPRLHRRDSLIALFWPESGDEQARRSLRQALHFLRQTLGPGVLASRGDEEIGVDFGAVWCDVRELERALDAGRLDEAAALYRGHLLEGFHVSGVAPELGQWLEDERSRLRARAVGAASSLADQAERDGNLMLAVQRLREVLRLEPGSEAALRRLMALLDRTGDRAGALRAYDEFARRLATDVEAEPSPETSALAERMRAGREARGTAAAPPHAASPLAPAGATTAPPPTGAPAARAPRRSAPLSLLEGTVAAADPAPRRHRNRRPSWLPAAVAALVVGLATLTLLLPRNRSGATGHPAPPTPVAPTAGSSASLPSLPSLAEVTTTSVVAREFYGEGVRAYYQSDPRAALRLFRAALAEDSLFAMAAYFASRITGGVEGLDLAAQAVRMSRGATERERLLIAAHWAEKTNNPSVVALAESLARRYPLEPEVDVALGRALAWSGDFVAAIPHFRQAVERDSVSLVSPASGGGDGQPVCTACEAFGHLVNAYAAVDSQAAAERTAREWIRRQPGSVHAWANLAVILGAQGRAAEALEAWRTRQTLYGDAPPDDAFERARVAIQAGDFAEADRLLAERVRDGGAPVREEALWWQVVSYRNQGRLEAALRAARRVRQAAGDGDPVARLPEAQVLFEMGRARDAARLFEAASALARYPVPEGAPDPALGLTARSLGWHVTHVAVAYAAAGDTARLARLADSVEALTSMGAYGRDRRLPHHLRGLLLLARGRREAAAAAFRRAIFSPTRGYTRTNLELGRTLMALGRPREAAAVLAPALRGDLQSSNYYVTHAELHEALAQAFEAAGEPDLARAHYAWVANAWRAADAPFRARAAAARRKAR